MRRYTKTPVHMIIQLPVTYYFTYKFFSEFSKGTL